MTERRKTLVVGAVLLLACGLGLAEDAPDAFAAWVQELREEALAREISAATLDAALADIEPLERVLELDRDQPEFKLTFAQYMDRVVSPKRIERGRRLYAEHRELLEEIRERYNVQPRFVVALWGIESDYGRRMGTFSVVEALATLAYDGRRAEFFRGELLDALHILDEGHISPDGMLGSWAGALGQPQFMPSSFRAYAVDHDGDERQDIWGSTADVLASAANYLASSGWKGSETWGREVRLPEGFDTDLIGRESRRKLAAWQELGVRRIDGRDLPRADMTGTLVRPDGDSGRVFMTYGNYQTILRWNRSNYFATAVGLLSDQIARR